MPRARRNKYEGLNASDRAHAQMRYTGRNLSGDLLWTAKEDAIVLALFPDYDAMGKRLRRRSLPSLYYRTSVLGLRKTHAVWTTTELSSLRRLWRSGSRSELIAAFPRHPWSSIEKKAQRLKLRRPWVPKITGRRTLDEIRQRAAALHISLRDLDRICGARGYFRSSACRIQPPRRNIILRAIAALGGRVEIVWE